MKRPFSWPLFLGAAALLSAATWLLVESLETRIAGAISAMVIAWGFVRFAMVDDQEAGDAAPMADDFSDDAAESLVRSDIWSRGAVATDTVARFEAQLRLPLLAIVRRRS